MRQAQHPLPNRHVGEDVVDEMCRASRHPAASAPWARATNPSTRGRSSRSSPHDAQRNRANPPARQPPPEEVAKLLLHKAREALAVSQRRGLRAECLEIVPNDPIQDGGCGIARRIRGRWLRHAPSRGARRAAVPHRTFRSRCAIEWCSGPSGVPSAGGPGQGLLPRKHLNVSDSATSSYFGIPLSVLRAIDGSQRCHPKPKGPLPAPKSYAREGCGPNPERPGLAWRGTASEPVPVTGLAANFSPFLKSHRRLWEARGWDSGGPAPPPENSDDPRRLVRCPGPAVPLPSVTTFRHPDSNLICAATNK